MNKKNPYAISFGRIPNQYISRDILIEDVLDELNSDIVDEQAFKITGVRGTGKTVTLTAIEKKLREEKNWIVIDLKSNSDVLNDLIANLYSEVPFLATYVDANLNLSAFGIGVNISDKKPTISSDVAIKKILREVKKRKKRVLVVIDEVRKTDAIIDFIQEFQILIREELPIYLIVAGLYEDVEEVENADGLTFFLRASKIEMTPLSLLIIKEKYKETLGISEDVADELSKMTKGYAFAYQAFGKYMWESEKKEITGLVLAQVDEALSQKVYNKIWSELRPVEKWFLSFIAIKESLTVNELLEMSKKKHNEWSTSRKRLIEKGIIDGSIRGQISLRLPRFKEYIKRHEDL